MEEERGGKSREKNILLRYSENTNAHLTRKMLPYSAFLSDVVSSLRRSVRSPSSCELLGRDGQEGRVGRESATKNAWRWGLDPDSAPVPPGTRGRIVALVWMDGGGKLAQAADVSRPY